MEKTIYDPAQLTGGGISHRLKIDMEDTKDEVIQGKDTKKTTEKTVEPEEVVRVRKAWQEANKRRERAGRTVTAEEKRAQEEFIKSGVKPPEEALSPQKIEELLLSSNSGAQVEALIAELKLYEKTGAVTAAYFGELERVVNVLISSHKIPSHEGTRLLDEARAMAIKQMGRVRGGADEQTSEQGGGGRGGEQPPTATGGSSENENDEARVANEARNYQARKTTFYENPDNLREAQEKAQQFAAGATLPPGISIEDIAPSFLEIAKDQVFGDHEAARRVSQETPEIRRRRQERLESAAGLEHVYIEARQAIIGEVDASGNVISPPQKTMQQLIDSLKAGEIRTFLTAVGEAEGKNWNSRIEGLLQEPNERVFREKLAVLVDDAEDTRAAWLMHERNFNPPNSIQEIAQDIVATDLADYRTGGKYAMFKRVRENGGERMKFQQHNFIRWARYKMLKWEEDNPDDPQDMFKLVGIFGTTRGVSLSEMILTPGFFRDRDTGEILEDLKLDLIYQAWPWGFIRDSNIQYRLAKGSDEDLGPKAIGPIYEKNVLTKPDVLNRMVNMSDIMEEFDPNEKNSKTGQALRMALMTYHDLTNPVILEKMMKLNGKDLAFFDNRKFLEKYVEGQMFRDNKGKYEGEVRAFGDRYSAILFKRRNEGDEALSAEENRFLDEARRYDKGDPRANIKRYVDTFFDLSKMTGHLFDSNGQLKRDAEGPRTREYLNTANIFLLAQPSDPLIKEVRERIRLSVMERFGIDYDSARWVEAWAYKTTPFTGINSRNDTTSTGFDSYSKTLNTGYYAQHQSHARRGGAYGNKYDMYQFKRLGMDFFSITTDAGPSILEYIQGGQGNEVDFGKQANVMVFGENTMSQFYSNHVLRTFNEFHELIESKSLKLHEIVNTDPYGRVHYDSQKFNELVRDTFLKNMRYPYSTWGNLDFTEEIMMFEEKVGPNGLPIPNSLEYKSRPIARHMFGKAMFNGMYSVMLEYEDIADEHTRLDAKRYFQIEKRLNALVRNADYAKSSGKSVGSLSLEARLQNDTENALTQEEKEFLVRNREWFYSKDMSKVRDIVSRMDTAFVGAGRQNFWKEAAKVRLAAELKEARKRLGNVQTMMSFEEVEKFLSAISQLDANILGDEGDFAGARPMDKVFTKEDIAWIRKMSGTGFLRMGAEDIGRAMAYGGFEGIWKALSYLVSNTAKG